MCGFVPFATAGEGEASGHTVLSAHQAEEHHVSQRTADLWNNLDGKGLLMVIESNLKTKSRPAQNKLLWDLSRWVLDLSKDRDLEVSQPPLFDYTHGENFS